MRFVRVTGRQRDDRRFVIELVKDFVHRMNRMTSVDTGCRCQRHLIH